MLDCRGAFWSGWKTPRDQKMRTVVKDRISGWRGLTIGVPKGLVVAPVIFLTYINEMLKGIISHTSLLTDDVKIKRRVLIEDTDAKVVLSPHRAKGIRKIEEIQRAAIKMVCSVKDLLYGERLSRMELLT